MARKIKKKKSFGHLYIDHFSPPLSSNLPKVINTILSFEEALKLHLGLGQLLGRLNSYNRATTKGRKSAVNLCIFRKSGRITINEGFVR